MTNYLISDAQHESIKAVTAQQQFRPKQSTNISLFAAVLNQIHGYALRNILQEKSKLSTRGPSSSERKCSIERSFGPPCCHKTWLRILLLAQFN
ncbi:hypothetical protein V1507DRAFT_213398 [Lipomyces tetrasporus]